MKNLIKYFLCLATLISLNTCIEQDLTDDSNCTFNKNQLIELTNANMYTTASFNFFNDNGYVVYQWSKYVENVCTKEKVTSYFTITLKHPENAIFFSARGKINYLVQFSNIIPLEFDNLTFRGKTTTDIGNGGSDPKGAFVHELELLFTSTGSYASDSAFIKNNIESISISSDYREYK
ncbi:MAG TPA: hypothetical protein VK590_09300 [Saprospiraceae bacterium]|nr:hypothetical protein [Saprospiraceae bacterium]